ncbi:protein-tyrosine-phosphatase [Winslowiella iniecta]|uniref:protein-tyrosine-phosphatase n=1 Tax=Winslowiella iniecta TaxID=1560201 RepID=A0A0L7T1V6_9GAMM|nr:protein-tyrosine-phosphatase [Winslowiella iniecta]KOC89226.1 protein tyrosine phosphatase [Winslowiella iniecta]KOC92148.1 protein tyrosine phosphatase [Winslowiella iniecta]
MFNSVLIVCVGNICRSPTGERLLRKYCPNLKVDSAGLGALVGHEADASAKAVAEKRELSLESHSAQQITASMCRSYDLILVMEKKHINDITKIAPEVRGKTMLFGHWASGREIPDPYRKSMEAFESVYLLLDDAAQKWAHALNR